MQDKGLSAIFSEVSGRYERMNRVMTLGMDVFWRRKAARIAAFDGGQLWLDVCTGTGEMAVDLKKLAGNGTMLISADFSISMIREALSKPETSGITFVTADAKRLPFRDEIFDLVSISFGSRNLNLDPRLLTGTFGELHRILRPGGRLLNLETSQPASELVRKLFHIYTNGVTRVGNLATGSKEGYRYLAESMRGFYGPDELSVILKDAGFTHVEYTQFSCGAVAVHKAVK